MPFIYKRGMQRTNNVNSETILEHIALSKHEIRWTTFRRAKGEKEQK